MTADHPPPSHEVEITAGSLSLADVRQDMAKIFGDSDRALTGHVPKTMAVRVRGATTRSLPIKRPIAGMIVAAAAAGLLIGMAIISILYGSYPRNRVTPISGAPATGVAASPFERANSR